MSLSRRRRGASPDPLSRRHRSRSRSRSRSLSNSRHNHRSRSRSRSPPSSRPPRRSRSPPSARPPGYSSSPPSTRPPRRSRSRSPLRLLRRAPAFPSHHDEPNISKEVRLICGIVSSPTPSHSLISLLDNTGIRVTPKEVQDVLRLSYSHPAPALTFFRWAGERHLNHNHSPYSWNLVVDMLGKNRHFDQMWDTVRSMRDLSFLSLTTFVAIFECLAYDGRAGEAFAAFCALPMYGIPRNTDALNALLAAFCRVGLLEDARVALHESWQVGVKPDADSFAVLLEGCEKEKDAKSAQKVFDDMITTFGWDPINMQSYDSFLVTLLSSLDDGFIEAMRYLEDLRRHNCSPGPKFFCAALQLCHSKSEIRRAIALWEDYIETGVCPPNTAMYNCIIALSCKERRLEAARRYFDEMVLRGAFPDPDTYNALFQMLVKSMKEGEALVVLNEMLKNECLPTHTNCILALYTKSPELCIKVWQCMLTHGIHPLEEAGNMLVSMLEGHDLLPEACKYAQDLIDNGVKLTSANLTKLKKRLKEIHKEHIYDHLLSKWKQH